jgi:membrane protein
MGRGGAKLSLSLLIALWVASNGMIAVSRTLNTACGLRETRRWWRRRLIAMALTIAFAVLIICALVLIFYGAASADRLADRFGLGPYLPLLWRVFRWPLILTFVVISFEMIYNYAPNLGESPSRQWWTPGAFTGVALFLLASFGLRIYLAYFHAYSTTYGSLGAVILTLVWFYLTAFAILMGGEVNSEIAKEISRRKELAEKPVKRRRFPGRRRAR